MLNQLLDAGIVEPVHGWLFLVVFTATALLIAWEVRASSISPSSRRPASIRPRSTRRYFEGETEPTTKKLAKPAGRSYHNTPAALPGRSGSEWGSPANQFVGVIIAGITSIAAWIVLPEKLLALGLLAATILTVLVGKQDEKQPLRPAIQLIWQVSIAVVLVMFGWTIPYVTHPFQEGILNLNWITIATISFPADLIAIIWIVLLMNVINWIDGSDGLASSISFVAFAALATIALLPAIQNQTGFALAIIGLSATLAFFIWNAPPAKVYLGTTGSWFLGLFLALSSMYGGGKIATGALILALPLLDAAYVLIRRLRDGQLPWQGDTRNHIHHRLQQLGVSRWEIIVAAFIVTGWLALVSILVATTIKLLLAGLLIAALGIGGLRLLIIHRRIERYEQQ